MGKGREVRNLEDLRAAAENRRAVIVPASRAWAKPQPASRMEHMPGVVLLRLFRCGMWIYEKETK